MAKADYEQARAYALGRLAAELAPDLVYHSLQHTRDDVLPAVLRLAQISGVADEDRLCLATAAVYHDTGFLISYSDHETHSIGLARAVLPGFAYSPQQIDHIVALIAATRMPQRPATLLAQLLCDADLDVLGREDFWDLNQRLLAETRRYGPRGPIAETDWLRGQAQFLQDHAYFSAAAHALRDEGKARNLALMRAALAAADGRAGREVLGARDRG